MNDKQILTGLFKKELAELLNAYPSFRSVQIYEWILKGVFSFDEMKNIPLPLRKELSIKFSPGSGEVISVFDDPDGTVKLGIKLKDSSVIEGVILSDGKGRKTACISTQAGCPAGCLFCRTGSIGFERNLTASEISEQFLRLRSREKDISHIVIMGMGEPLLNLAELRSSLDFIMDKDGINISKRRITLSTCGIAEGIIDLAENGPDIRLALSLTTAREELRTLLMPVSRNNPLPVVKEALLVYQKKRKQRLTLEMVLLGGINTTKDDVKAAKDFSRGLDAVINLIPWNPVPGLEFKGSPIKRPGEKEVANFADELKSAGLNVTMRFGKGQGISGACGQLGLSRLQA